MKKSFTLMFTLSIVTLISVRAFAQTPSRPAGYPGAYCASAYSLPAWSGGTVPANARTYAAPEFDTSKAPAGYTCYYDTTNGCQRARAVMDVCRVVCIPSGGC